MPRFDYHSNLDHRLDNQIVEKGDLRFSEQDTAEDFATTEYQTDTIPRSVLRTVSGMHVIVESPEPRLEGYVPNPREVFYINSMPSEG